MPRRVRNYIEAHANLDALLVGTGLILFWRGVWGIMDLYFFPGNTTLSFIASILIGLAILYFDDFKLEEIHVSGPAHQPNSAQQKKR